MDPTPDVPTSQLNLREKRQAETDAKGQSQNDVYLYIENAIIYETSRGPRVFLVNEDKKLKISKDVKTILGFFDGTLKEQDIVTMIAKEMKISSQEAKNSLKKVSRVFSDKGILKYGKNSYFRPLVYRPQILNPPFEMAYLELTYRCNLLCKHCYNAAGSTQDLPAKEWKKIIDEIFRCGGLRVFFTGGEPFLHKGFFEILSYAREKPMAVGVLTNGLLMNQSAAQKMKNVGVSVVHFSVDGPDAALHDEFRGVEGSFDRTIEGIKTARRKGLHVKVTISIQKKILGASDALIRLMNTLGVAEYSFTPVIKSFREEAYAVTAEEFTEFYRKVPARDKVFVYAPRYVKNCGIGYKECVIHPDGTVGLCPPFGAEGPILGDLKTEPLADIWKGSLLETLRSISAYDHIRCSKCAHISYCLGGCMADVYYQTKNIACGSLYACSQYSNLSPSSINVVELQETP